MIWIRVGKIQHIAGHRAYWMRVRRFGEVSIDEGLLNSD